MRKYYFFIFSIFFLMRCAGVKTAGTFRKLDENKFDKTTEDYLGTPYVWGGTNMSGVDCSGFATQVYKDQGILLPRTSKEQYNIGETVRKSNLKKGDLIFFNTFGRGISHVGLYVDDHRMIHASSSDGVKYTKYNTDYWTNKYIGSKRIVGSPYVKGENQNENIAVMSEFPMRVTGLISTPTPFTLDRRRYSLDFRTNVMGNLVISSSIGFWNRLELGTSFTITEVLGNEKIGIEMPHFNAKFRFWNEGAWYPSAAIGYANTKWKVAHEDRLGNLHQSWGDPRGLYLVGGKTIFDGWEWLLGKGRTFIGLGTTHLIKDLQLENLYMFVSYEQQLIRRVIVLAELDNIFRSGTINAGFRIALTSGTSVEFSLSNIFEKDIDTDRALRFTYFLDY